MPEGLVGNPHQTKGNKDQEIHGRKTHYQIAQPHGNHAEAQNQYPAVLQLVNKEATSDGTSAATDAPHGVHQPSGNGRQAELGINDRKDNVETVVVCVVERMTSDHACRCDLLPAFFQCNSYPTGKSVNA